jgi:hypothetical protein
MINIICLKWGKKYGPEYVNRLYSGVKRNTTVSFRFICFTDDSQGIWPQVETRPLPCSDQLDSWWNKLYLFSRDLPIPQGETVFYIDLDTLITGNIDHIINNDRKKLVALRDFYHGIAKSAGRVGSGLMSWPHGMYDHVWRRFIADPMAVVRQAHPHGDQWYVERAIPDVDFWQDLFPDHVVSFKLHCRKGLPRHAKIICYHGRPSIPESATQINEVDKWTIAAQPWVMAHWRDRIERCRVRYVELPAQEIFGMVGRCGGGYNSLWADWTPEGRRNREAIMQEYETELNRICGHYSKLESSILAEGIRNPVVITCGFPKHRPLSCVPPEMLQMDESRLLLLEGTTGGSRLHVAQKHNMTMPCIINDWTGRFDAYPEITHGDQARKYYRDQPESVTIDANGMLTESFNDSRVSYHLGAEWSEDRLMPQRAPMWLGILKKYGYTIERLSSRVRAVLGPDYQIPDKKNTAVSTDPSKIIQSGPSRSLIVRSFMASLPKQTNADEKTRALTYFAEGARLCGDDAQVVNGNTYVDCDVGAIIGNISSADPSKTRLPHYAMRKSVIDTQTRIGKYWLAVDSNIFIYRDRENPKKYLRYSFNGVFPATGIYCNESPGEENWRNIRRDYNMDLAPWRSRGSHILITLQRPHGWSMRGQDLMQWLDSTYLKIRQYSDRPLRLRWHPGDRKNYPESLDLSQWNATLSPIDRPIQEDLRDCWAVVCHNSGPSAVAVIEGIPAFVTDDPAYSQAGDVANTDLSLLENPRMPDRELWIRKLAQCHWSFEDLRSGRCWAHMRQWVRL